MASAKKTAEAMRLLIFISRVGGAERATRPRPADPGRISRQGLPPHTLLAVVLCGALLYLRTSSNVTVISSPLPCSHFWFTPLLATATSLPSSARSTIGLRHTSRIIFF